MWSKLSAVLDSFNKGFLKKLLAGAGIGLASSAVFMTAFTALLNSFQNSLGGVSYTILSLAHVAGIDTSLTILLSAMVTRLALNSSALSIRKAS